MHWIPSAQASNGNCCHLLSHQLTRRVSCLRAHSIISLDRVSGAWIIQGRKNCCFCCCCRSFCCCVVDLIFICATYSYLQYCYDVVGAVAVVVVVAIFFIYVTFGGMYKIEGMEKSRNTLLSKVNVKTITVHVRNSDHFSGHAQLHDCLCYYHSHSW